VVGYRGEGGGGWGGVGGSYASTIQFYMML